VVVKPWFEAEKMFFFYEINNFSQTGVFLNQTHHPLLLLQLLFANNFEICQMNKGDGNLCYFSKNKCINIL